MSSTIRLTTPTPAAAVDGSRGLAFLPADRLDGSARIAGRGRQARRVGLVILLLSTLLVSASLAGGPVPEVAHNEPEYPAALEVRVWEAESRTPVAGALVRIRQLDRQLFTGEAGIARFASVESGRYSLIVERMGYRPEELELEVLADRITHVEIELHSAPLDMGTVVVAGTLRQRGASDVYRPSSTLSGPELQRNLGASIPQTLNSVPGFSMQYNGPGATRPSIRGMGANRVLVLEDGHRTGDLYQTAADHGVMVEPLTIERIEVVRGPAGLMYGSNALGGVVNAIREDVPRSRPRRSTFTLNTHLESVNAGGGLGVVGLTPAGPLALRAELSGRRLGDTRTPLGMLERTDLKAADASLGIAWIPEWGYAGAAVRRYHNHYGVPGEFRGELIPGGHSGGVEIQAARTTARLRAAYHRPLLDFFQGLEADVGMTRYLHDELEGMVDGKAVVGAMFRQASLDANLTTHHRQARQRLQLEGAAGISLQRRDLTAGGVSPGSRSGSEWAVSGYLYEEFRSASFRVQAGVRYDYREITPASTDSMRVRTRQRTLVKPVAARHFGAVSASLAALWDFRPGWTLGVGLARSFRNPAIEELYSEGPHLADFSFDIGNPELDSEKGLGGDLFLRVDQPQLSLEIAGFANRIDNYIYYLQTGETVRVIREGARPRVTPVFEARGDDALFLGAESRIQWAFHRRLTFEATGSWTWAQRRVDDDPLPFIPPLRGHAALRWEGEAFSASAGTELAASQRRVPSPVQIGDLSELPQSPSRGYGLLNLELGWQGFAGPGHHRITLQVNNLTDRAWRDHLSRLKEVAPQPGRNLQLGWQVRY